MNFLVFWIAVLFLVGLSNAEEDSSLENQVLVDVNSDDETHVEGEVEGRACHDCHGGANELIDPGTQLQFGQPFLDLDWLWGLGNAKIFLIVAPILGLNIAIVVLLAIILKHVKIIADGIGYHEEPAYAYTYQTYDAGPAPYSYTAPSYTASSYGASKPSTGYTKRTSRGAPNFASRSTLNLVTDLFEKAVEKYTALDLSED